MASNLPKWFAEAYDNAQKKTIPSWWAGSYDKIQIEQEDLAVSNRNKESSDFETELLARIRRHEGGPKGYDSYFAAGTRYAPPAPAKPVSQMALGEVLAWQRQLRAEGRESSAMGAYQIIYDTLNLAKSSMKLSDDMVFDSELQDRIAREYLLRKKRGKFNIDAFLEGSITKQEFALSLAKEWASLPVLEGVRNNNGLFVSPGESFYKGVGSNKSAKDLQENLNKYAALFDLADIQITQKESQTNKEG